MPHVSHQVRVERWNVTVVLWAYRQLSEAELHQHAAYFLRTTKIKKGRKYDVMLTVGIRD